MIDMKSKIKRNKDEFLFNLKGRIQNLSLPASNTNSLIPLFEAISNSLHAIENKFQKNAPKLGRIVVEILRRDDEANAPIGFKITDNGIGLNSTNMESFRTSDSDYKKKKGGKGIGRLSWLKVFEKCSVISFFEENDAFWKRSFSFELDEKKPIKNHSLGNFESKFSGTEISLTPFITEFGAHCPKKASDIAAKIIGHFLPYFIVDRFPIILLKDINEDIDLRSYYYNNQIENDLDHFSLEVSSEEPAEFTIHHILLHKKLRFLETGGLHWMFYAGNDRVAHERAIANQLGLKSIGEERGIYVGLIISDFLDSRVNQERTAFSIQTDTLEKIHARAFESTKKFLSRHIDQLRQQQSEIADKIIKENPQFLYLDNIEDILKNLPLNMQSEEEIFIELIRAKRRKQKTLKNEVAELTEADKTQNLEKEIRRISRELSNQSKSSLAEYVVRRKEILKFLENALGYRDEDKRHYAENVIHNLIVPIRTNSEDLEYDQHNLWILDDRLAFYKFFRSDKELKSYTQGKSTRKPDLAFVFDPALAYERESTDEAIMIVEFKRPGRDDYSDKNNPVTQVLKYVDLFRKGEAIKNQKGRIIKPISEKTRFICYVIADLTDSLRNIVRMSPIGMPTSDGRGFYGYSQPHNAQIEIIPYEKILGDAKLRNEAFFNSLGISN